MLSGNKTFKFVGLVVLSISLAGLFGCDLLPADGLPLPPGAGGPGHVLYVHPDDPMILEMTTEEGEVLGVYGQKDAEGMATKLDFIRYQDAGQVGTDAATWLVYDDSTQLSQIIGEDGSTLSFDWQNDTEAVITAVSADGEIQVNIVFDFANPDGGGTAAKTVIADVPSRIGIPMEMRVYPQPGLPGPVLSKMRLVEDAASKAKASPVYVTVTRCGEAVNGATVLVSAGTPGAGLWPTYPASPTGTAGEYKVMLPTEQSGMGSKAESICKNMVWVLGLGCTAIEAMPEGSEGQVCLAIAAAIDGILAGPTGEGVPIFAACIAGFKAARLYCKTLGASPFPGAESPADIICNNIKDIVDQAYPPGDIGIGAIAYAGAENASASNVTAPGLGPFPSLAIDFGSKAALKSFTTSPADPGPGQGYTARADLKCLPENTTVTVSIAGSDGYASSTSETTGGNVMVELYVPGGGAEVRDSVTVTTSTGITRNIGIVF